MTADTLGGMTDPGRTETRSGTPGCGGVEGGSEADSMNREVTSVQGFNGCGREKKKRNPKRELTYTLTSKRVDESVVVHRKGYINHRE